MIEYRPVNAMDESARQLSLSLDGVAKALAEWTVTRHHELDESLSQRYGAGWRKSWVADVENRLLHLAQAIAVQRPSIFAHTVSWSGSALAARDAGNEDLATSLRCLRDVLQSELPETAGRRALEYVDHALKVLGRPPDADVGRLDPSSPHGRLALEYLEAVLDGRRHDAVALMVNAVESGLSTTELYGNVLQPAQIEIGRMWHRGEINVADEHFATAVSEHVMSVLGHRFDSTTRRDRRVVATAVRGDLHSLGVRMVAEFFEMDGWQVIYLGANMPGDDVIAALVDHKADLLAVSATSFLNLRALGDLIDSVRRRPDLDSVKVIVGGAPFKLLPDLWKELGADGTAASGGEAVDVANRLLAGVA